MHLQAQTPDRGRGSMMLSAEHQATLWALLVALDDVPRLWPWLGAAMREAGIDDPEAALEALRAATEDA